MKLELKNKVLRSILSAVKGVVPARPTFPLQGMVLVSPLKKGCYFYTQGPGAQIRYYSEDISMENPTKKLVSVSKINEISRNFAEDDNISLLFKDDFVTVSCEGGNYKLNSLPPDEFPLMPEPDKKDVFKLAEQDLKYLLEKTDFCMACQDPRHYLNGLFLSLDDKKLSAVATDSHRLALSSASVSGGGKTEGILPRDIVVEAKRLSRDSKELAELSVNSQKIVISIQNIQISAKGVNGQFPDYKKVIPKEFVIEIELDREEFLRSLQRASAISASSISEDGSHVNLVFSKKELLIMSSNPDGEEATVKQKIKYDKEAFEISFNSRYLQDVVKTLDTEQVCLQMRDATSGTRIIGKGSATEEYVVMPLRI